MGFSWFFVRVCAARWWSNNIHVRAVKPVGLHEKEKRRSVGRPPKPWPRELWAQHEIKFSSPCAQGIIYSLLVYRRPQRKSASNWFHWWQQSFWIQEMEKAPSACALSLEAARISHTHTIHHQIIWPNTHPFMINGVVTIARVGGWIERETPAYLSF